MYTKKEKLITIFSIFVFVVGISLKVYPTLKKDNNILEFEYINTKDISATMINEKDNSTSLLSFLSYPETDRGELEEISNVKVVSTRKENKTTKKKTSNKIWYLPTQKGKISQYPSAGHFAYDITSPRGSSELIFPVANGTISGVYRDVYGALIVTIAHKVNGKYYTSQYVHLSSYAKGIYVGKKVTVNDCIGRMGSTGNSSGVHLHFALVDNCNLFNKGTPCTDLGSYFTYGRKRYYSGFKGLGSVMKVPKSWNSR